MTNPLRSPCRALTGAALFIAAVLAGGGCARAQQPPKVPKPLPAPALMLAPLAGKPIAVLPVSYVVVDTGLAGLPVGRLAQFAWADSVLGEALQARGPEANWMLAPEVRRVAKRAPGMVANPDQMGQSVLRSPNLKKVYDPLLANLRSLVAMTGGRVVMIPAELRFTRAPDGTKVEATFVLADARSGAILWRSVPVATAPTAGAALAATIAWILPDAH